MSVEGDQCKEYTVIVAPGQKINVKADRVEHGNQLRFYAGKPSRVIAEFKTFCGWMEAEDSF